ncbi:MFS transporter [bacterium]|nr:MFS transporter [bacterium]
MRDDDRTRLDRSLSPFAEVRGGEGRPTILLALAIFLLLTAYYIIKPLREGLILAGGGAAVKSYASAGQALLLLGLVPLYGRLADRLPRLRLITVVTFFFVACLVVFFLLGRAGVPLGVAFFLWVGIFNVMIIAQLWSFANDLFRTGQGKRLFAIIGFGASSGAVVGNVVVGGLIEPLGLFVPMLLAAALLVVSLGLTRLAASYEAPPEPGHDDPGIGEATRDDADPDPGASPMPGTSVFRLMARNGYLVLLALLILVTNWVNTTGEYLLGEFITRAAASAPEVGAPGGPTAGEWIGAFYARFFLVVNVTSLATQLFLVSRLVKYLGVGICLLILPVIALGGYALLIVYPVLTVVRWAKTAENATDYSLQNTVRNMLWLPTTREEKYKAKQFVDTFCWRLGDVLSATVVFVGTRWLALSLPGFATFNLVLVGFWLVIAVLVGRRFRRLVPDHTP